MDLTCPKCTGVMRAYERNGVTVDQCSECRGIFLDRGELERLTDAERKWHGDDKRGRDHRHDDDDDEDYKDRGGYRGEYGGHGSRRKKKRSFLEELFE